MKFSQDCLDLCKESEGCELNAYRDAVGVLTVGYGHTGPDVTPETKWTQAQADLQLGLDLEKASNYVESLVHVQLTQGQHDALTDFVFNMGAGSLQKSTLLKLLNKGDYAAVPDQLYRVDENGVQRGWIFGGGEVLPGLVVRRNKEIDLWNKVA